MPNAAINHVKPHLPLLKKVIWSVDPFEEPGPIRENVLGILRALLRRAPLELELVYLLTPAELKLSIDFTEPWLARYQPPALKALEALSQQLELPADTHLTVLSQKSSSRKSAADQLCHHATLEGVDLILVGTHARRGMDRLLMGSFAETLILYSKLPVLVVGPDSVALPSFETILFPTDFSSHSRVFFEYITHLADQLHSRIDIFHCMPSMVKPALESGMYLLGTSWIPMDEYMQQDSLERTKNMQAWVHWAEKKGVHAEYHLDQESHNATHSILAHVEKSKPSLIAMAARSGPVATALLGSVARQVVRHARCPVWVLHPQH